MSSVLFEHLQAQETASIHIGNTQKIHIAWVGGTKLLIVIDNKAEGIFGSLEKITKDSLVLSWTAGDFNRVTLKLRNTKRDAVLRYEGICKVQTSTRRNGKVYNSIQKKPATLKLINPDYVKVELPQ